MNAQVLEFLQTDRHAVLATKRANGAPQLTPVWYLFDVSASHVCGASCEHEHRIEDGVLYVSAQVSTVKVRNLRRDPSLTVCIDGGRGDARYVVFYGKAELIEPGQRQETMRRRIIGHYYADQAAARYYESMKNTPGVIIVLKPERIVLSGFSSEA